MSVRKYTGKEVEISYDPKLCIHAAECVRGAPDAFKPQARPWVAPDAAPADQLAQTVQRCPTGALTLHYVSGPRKGVSADTPDATNSLAIRANGPLYLRGTMIVHAADGTATHMTRAALCRCGASANKPFCDGSHTRTQFAEAGGCGGEPPANPQSATGQVAIKPNINGSLLIEGWLEFTDANGNTSVRGDKTWLCRCGASKNKPFCDGSHKAIGFQG